MPLSELMTQLSELAARDDVEGLAALLESWPRDDRGDEWIGAVEARMRAPSSTADQKTRMRALREDFREANKGDDLQVIRSGAAIAKKLIELEDADADLAAPRVIEWLESFDAFELVLEKLPRIPESIGRMRNLEQLELIALRLPKHAPRVPSAISTLEKLQVLVVAENKLETLPPLPRGLKRLVVGGNPDLQLDVSGMTELEALALDGVRQAPIGIEDLVNLQELSWRNSKCDSFPDEFLALPRLERSAIYLEGSEMELPDEPPKPEFSGSYADQELQHIALAVVAFNDTIKAMPREEDDDEDYSGFEPEVFVDSKPATEELLAKLTATSGRSFPLALAKFYRGIGGLGQRYPSDAHALSIPTAEDHLKSLTTEIGPLKSMGLIDRINWSYSDQVTANSEEGDDAFSQAELDLINERYTCIGNRTSDWGYEAAHFLYFDDQGRFGSIYYNQSGSHDFGSELRQMLEASPATATLAELLENCLTIVESEIREARDEE